jgi:hypothetical protein
VLPAGVSEKKVAVAAKKRSADLLERIDTMKMLTKWCVDCLGCLGWLGWLAWLSWLPWKATLEASEGPNSDQKAKNALLLEKKCVWDLALGKYST